MYFTKNLSKAISIKLSDLISKRFRYSKAILQNRSYFYRRAEETILYQKIKSQTEDLATVDAYGQVIAQSPRKGLEAIIFLILIIGMLFLTKSEMIETRAIVIGAILALKVLPSFQAIYHSFQMIRNNFSAYKESVKYLDVTSDLNDTKNSNINEIHENKQTIELSSVSVNFESEIIKYPNIIFNLKKLNIIIGASGCGKSTLLKAISNQVNYFGTIKFTDVKPIDCIVYYGQSQTLLPGTVYENLNPFNSKKIDNKYFLDVLEKFKINEIMPILKIN